ncbi:MAG: DUF5110 domain-containing protein [Opitutales bacterium]|nr:DUF5110 domain-containing protein [Opitutales bacterium]
MCKVIRFAVRLAVLAGCCSTLIGSDFTSEADADTTVALNLNPVNTEPLPPKWMFGYIQSQWGEDSFGYGDQESFLAHARSLRGMESKYGNHRHPLDVMVLDMAWCGNNWDWPKNMVWDSERFPDPVGMIEALHEMHIKIAMNYHDGGFGGEWLALFSRDLYMGLDVPWLDFWKAGSTEELQVWERMKFIRGKDTRLAIIGRHYARPNTDNWEPETADTNGIGILKIPSEDAMEKSMPVHWTGDVEGSWLGLQESVEALVYGPDGASGGWSYLHTDTPGHKNGTDPELAARWIQFSCFTTTTRNHGITPRDVWSWGEQVEEISYNSRMLRYRLLPYLYTGAWQIWDQALPLTRPMKLAFPGQMDDEKYQFMFGDWMLVAPVCKQVSSYADNKMPVRLPTGCEWVDYHSHDVYAGGSRVEVDVSDIGRVPLYVRRGAIIPMGPEIEWIDPTVHADPLTLDIYPLAVGSSSWSVYDDDGESLAYQRGQYSLTSIACEVHDFSINIHIGPAKGEYSGKPQSQRYVLKVNLMPQAPERVLINGVQLERIGECGRLDWRDSSFSGWSHDSATNTVFVHLSAQDPSQGHTHVSIELE